MFPWYPLELLGECMYTEKYKQLVGYSMIYHERTLHIYVITCRDRKYSGQHGHEWDIRVEHDGKVGCITVAASQEKKTHETPGPQQFY